MKRFAIILLSLLSLAFIVETPEMRRERARDDRVWHKAMAKSFDLPALRLFLLEHISKNPVCDGVDLKRSSVAKKWKRVGRSLSCGDWYLVSDSPDDRICELLWTYEEVRLPDRTLIHRVVEVSVLRDGRSGYTVVKTERRDDEMVELLP
jgi:hypothetical protein